MMQPLEVAGMISEFLVPLQLKRFPTPTIDATFGSVVPGSPVVTTLVGAAHYTRARKWLDMLPNAEQTRALLLVYTTSELKLAPADLIVHAGKDHKATEVHDYALQGGVFVTLASQIQETL